MTDNNNIPATLNVRESCPEGYRYIRARVCHVSEMVQALRSAGYEAEWGMGVHSYLDHDWDTAHEYGTGSYPDGKWGAIRTNASGNRAHAVWVAAGLVENNRGWLKKYGKEAK